MATTTLCRSDALPAKRDETAEQLRRLADLVQADRWEEADALMTVACDGFDTLYHHVKTVKRKRREDEHGYEPPRTEQLEACRIHMAHSYEYVPPPKMPVWTTQRDPDDAPKRLPPLVQSDDPLQRLDRELNMEMLRWASSHRWAR